MFIMTTDTDWATPMQVEEIIRWFNEHDIPATFFSTGDYLCLQDLAKRDPYAVGPHPSMAGKHHKTCEFEDHLLEHRTRYPEASGYRCHGFYDSAWIQMKMVELGYTWESNACHHLESHLRATRMFSGLMRFPVWLEDDVWMQPGHQEGPDELEAAMYKPGLKVMNFHPKHLCENECVRSLLEWIAEYVGNEWKTIEEMMNKCYY